MLSLSRFRMLILMATAILSNSYLGTIVTRMVNTNSMKGVCIPYLNCYSCPSALFSCPIGIMQHFMAIRAVPYMLIGFLGVVGLSVGRMACGWLCPFGLVQDLLYKIRSRKYLVPKNLKYLKYGILVVFVLLLPFFTGVSWFSLFCPAGKLTAGLPWMLWDPVDPVTGATIIPGPPGALFYFVTALLFVFLIWFVFSKRPFCVGFCPLGAIFALFNRISLVRLQVDINCDGCKTCNANCPMGLDVPVDVSGEECIRCMECTRCGHVKLVNPFEIGGLQRDEQRRTS